MKKIYTAMFLIATALVIFGITQIPTGNALQDLGNGTYIIEESELASLSDTQIANYMASNLVIDSIEIQEDKIEIVYNVVLVEPTHVNDTYKVFNHPFQTFVTLDDLNFCLSQTTMNNCVGYLVTGTESTVIDLGDNETRTITPTYKKAVDYGIRQYYRAIEFRDAISDKETMESFVNAI